MQLTKFIAMAFAAVLSACGGGADSEPTPDARATDVRDSSLQQTAAIPETASVVYLESDPDDWIGRGERHIYTKANSRLLVTQSDGLLKITVDGNAHWVGYFKALPPRMQAGAYRDMHRWPFYTPGMEWTRVGSGCNRISGWFVVDEITYSGAQVLSLAMRFEQHCEEGAAALRGRIRWNLNDPTEPPGPAPIRPKLWSAPEGAVPGAGDHVYLHSPAGDYVGQGLDYLYTTGVTASSNGAAIQIQSNGWYGSFIAMDSLQRLQPGFYAGLRGFHYRNPAKGGFEWWGQSRTCGALARGWFAIDKIGFDASGELQELEMRFSQRCTEDMPPLRGQVRWRKPAPPG